MRTGTRTAFARPHTRIATGEGLRIELMEAEKGWFFSIGVAVPSGDVKEILTLLAQELGKLPNKVSIEATRTPSPSPPTAITATGSSRPTAPIPPAVSCNRPVSALRVTQVRGFADQRLRKPDLPEDTSNRRISLIVNYLAEPNVPAASDRK